MDTVRVTVLLVAVVLGAVAGQCPELVTKEEWGAGPVTIINKVTPPVPYVVIHHTYEPPACNTTAECSADMRSMQKYHQSKGWNDIGYNFAIGGDNNVYEGRGWDVEGAHAPQYNNRSVGICFIGDYRTATPTESMLNLALSLIQCGISRGSISPDYKLLGHRQVRQTECPGDALFSVIEHWAHWENMTDIVPRTDPDSPDQHVH